MHLIIIDTEFTDFNQPQLISIGALMYTPGPPDASESECIQQTVQHKHYYAQCVDFDSLKTSSFVQEHVLPLLGPQSMPTEYALEYFVRFTESLGAPFALAADSRWDEKVLLQALSKHHQRLGPHYQGFLLLQDLITQKAYDHWQGMKNQPQKAPFVPMDQSAFLQRMDQINSLFINQAESFLSQRALLPHHALHDAQSIAFSFERIVHQIPHLLFGSAPRGAPTPCASATATPGVPKV